MNLNRTLRKNRKGNIAAVSVFVLSTMIAVVAYSVNVGQMTVALAQLQNASDGSCKASAWKLLEQYGTTDAVAMATSQAQAVVKANMDPRGVDSTLLPQTDLDFGKYAWNPHTNQYDVTWGTTPANLVRTKLFRLDGRGNSVILALNKFLDRETVELKSVSSAAFMAATGFQAPTGNNKLEILPFALDIDTWIAMENGSGTDTFSVNPTTNAVTPGTDGKREIKIFPVGADRSLPSGNRGTLRFGANNNSTSKLSRQIREGLDSNDMAYHSNGFSVANGPIDISGDPGVSAAIESDLNLILGQDRVLPLFTSVNGNGANASYRIVKFVGVKVVKADLRGALAHKAVLIQPSSFVVEEATTNMKMPVNQTGNIFAKPFFINIQ